MRTTIAYVGVLAGLAGLAGCGGGTTTDGGTDASSSTDSGGHDSGGTDSGGTDSGGTDLGGIDLGGIDLGTCDADHDGHAAMGGSCGGDDCDDADASVHPTQVEVCNHVDDDCDGTVDDGVGNTYYVDADHDLHGDSTSPSVMDCSLPAGYAENMDDCDDAVSAVHPGAVELCDGIDNDCNGAVDDGTTCSCTSGSARSCGAPGRCSAGTQTCIGGLWGACSIMGVPETCNGEDDDCDGAIDNGVQVGCYTDADGDTYAPGGAAATLLCPDPARPAVGGCPSGYTNLLPRGATADCDDTSPTAHPGATEVCNGDDDNCNGTIDEGLICP